MPPDALRLLVIDDDEATRTTLHTLLTRAFPGVEILNAVCGADGIQQAQTQRPDVILLDILLPDLNGFEVCRRLKADPRFGHIPIICVTGARVDRDARVTALEAGAEAFVTKPIDDIELVAQVRAMVKVRDANLSRHQEREQLAGMVADRTAELERELAERRRVENALKDANEKLRRDQIAMLNLVEDQRRTADSLRQSHALNASLIETIPYGMDIVDQEGHILYMSPGMERLAGKPATGRFCWDVYRDDRTQCDACPLKRPIQVGETQVLETSGAFGGRTLSINHTGMIYRGRPALLEIFRDVTDHMQVEKERMRLATAIAQAAEAIVITDADANILYANPAFERNTGYTRDDVLGQNPRVLQSGRHDAAFYRQMWDTLARGEVWHGHFTNKRKDGLLFEEEATISPVRDATGQIVNYIAVKLDVTHQAELEAQLRQAQKVEAIGQLAGGVAHDFNNLLYIILGYSEMILSQANVPEALRPLIQEIHKAGERASELTRQLLAFSRKQIVQPKVFDLGAAVTGMVKMIERLIGEDIRLHVRAPALACFTKADPGQIGQVVINLCVNARDAMPRGGQLTLSTTMLTVDGKWLGKAPALPPGEYVVLSVSDTGTGMTAEVQEHLFEPFFTTKGVGKGTGLGLATCYGIVKQSGGDIAVYSELNVGTTFRIYLPSARQPDTTEHRAEPPVSTYRSQGETILLAEDEAALRDLTARALRALGYEVLVAADGASALRLVNARGDARIDLLLADVIMPGMSGTELAATVRAARPEIKTLFLSGYPDDTIAQHGVLEPGVELLTKPVTSVMLARRIRELLDKQGAGGRVDAKP